jgi:hypothetical protein
MHLSDQASEAARKNIGTVHAFIPAGMPSRGETPLTSVDDKVLTDNLDDQLGGHEEKG